MPGNRNNSDLEGGNSFPLFFFGHHVFMVVVRDVVPIHSAMY